ncbi:MAG: VanZ family protein [Taibaiella sp.]|nr:VanZ family protein [Taibaiella sp.]
MKGIFSTESPFKKYARFMAVLWTLFIFVGCLYPSRELPKVDVPFFDKWTHFVLFGVFTFLWLWSGVVSGAAKYVVLITVAILLGVTIEGLQAVLVSLGRSAELMDAVADAVGALLGAGVFHFAARNRN